MGQPPAGAGASAIDEDNFDTDALVADVSVSALQAPRARVSDAAHAMSPAGDDQREEFTVLHATGAGLLNRVAPPDPRSNGRGIGLFRGLIARSRLIDLS